MWKESYRIGVELIDQQHMELFNHVTELVQAVRNGSDRGAYRRILSFLKDYVVFHFRTEEEYQLSVEYPHYEQHKKAHENFTRLVEEHVQRLITNDFDPQQIKDLVGMLSAWLIYHVGNTDVRIVRGEETAGGEELLSNLHILMSGVADTLQVVAGLQPGNLKEYDTVGESDPIGDVFVTIDLMGDIRGQLTYSYTKELAFSLVKTMMMLEPDSLDELVCSALAEITNISAGNAVVKFSKRGLNCDISTPQVFLEPRYINRYGGLGLDTGMGHMHLSAILNAY